MNHIYTLESNTLGDRTQHFPHLGDAVHISSLVQELDGHVCKRFDVLPSAHLLRVCGVVLSGTLEVQEAVQQLNGTIGVLECGEQEL